MLSLVDWNPVIPGQLAIGGLAGTGGFQVRVLDVDASGVINGTPLHFRSNIDIEGDLITLGMNVSEQVALQEQRINELYALIAALNK